MFKQPRVPEYRENEGAAKHLRALTLFLKDFCQDVWTASRNTDKGLSGISYPVTSVNKKTGDVTISAADVGARADTWLPSHNNIKTMTLGTWDGNTTPNDIPFGITYAVAGDITEGHGFPAGFVTVFALKDSLTRLFQLLVVKETGKMYVRSAYDGATWGDWREYATKLDAYPVGSIYMSVNSTSPASLFGGTWTAIQDRFLIGQSSTYPAGNTGGEATHTLTVAEMPSHRHVGIYANGDANYEFPYGAANTSVSSKLSPYTSGGSGGAHHWITAYTGSGSAHNNLPPWLAVYMWKRVS